MAVVSVEMGFYGKLVEEVGSPSGGVNTFDYSIPDMLQRGGPGTSPVMTEVWSAVMALTGGALTISLAALARTGRTALDLTGLRVIGYRIDNTSAAALTFIAGAINPYTMFTASGVVVAAGGSIQAFNPTGFGTVGAAALGIDVSGAGTESFRIGLVAGPV